MKNKSLLICTALSCLLHAQVTSANQGFWNTISKAQVVATNQKIYPSTAKYFDLDVAGLQQFLKQHASQAVQQLIITLPNAEGTLQDFYVMESPCMEPALAAAFPHIKTYTIIQVDNPMVSGKIDFTDFGFHGIVFGDKTYLIDPVDYNGGSSYQVYYKKDYMRTAPKLACELNSSNVKQPSIHPTADGDNPVMLRAHGNVRKNYRLALACTGEYAQAVTGTSSPTKSAVLSKMVTTINRVNGIYERDLAVHLTIIANNTNIIYTSPSTDPFNNWDSYDLIEQNQDNTHSVIGAGNYDIGHVFSTGGGGLATLASICNSSEKAEGVTGSSTPMGDAYDVDYVAHEIGHQLGANHTFNSCDGNEEEDVAFEPGSGSTIMAYAGICDDRDNLQNNSDDYFHPASLVEISKYISGESWGGFGSTCGTTSAGPINISIPNTTALYAIPAQTAFELEAPAVTWSGGPITYQWEQWNLGQIGRRENVGQTATLAPIFRSRRATTSRWRSFPHRDSVLANKYNIVGERTPTVSRTVNAKLLVKGLSSDGYGSYKLSDHQVNIQVNNTGAAFQVTQPNASSVTWETNTYETVNWQVAGTNTSPINATKVNIYLSLDGGQTYPYLIGENLDNVGTASVFIPVGAMTNTARVKVKGANNVFYDVSNANFKIIAGPNSIDQVQLNDQFTLYPNPTAGLLHINAKQTDATYTINVMNIIGQQLYSATLQSTNTIDISSYASGTYIIEIVDARTQLKAVYKINKH